MNRVYQWFTHCVWDGNPPISSCISSCSAFFTQLAEALLFLIDRLITFHHQCTVRLVLFVKQLTERVTDELCNNKLTKAKFRPEHGDNHSKMKHKLPEKKH